MHFSWFLSIQTKNSRRNFSHEASPLILPFTTLGFPGGTCGKEPSCQCRRRKRRRFNPWVGKIPWRMAWQPTPVFLPGESHGQRSLAGYSPWGHKESDTTETTVCARVCMCYTCTCVCVRERETEGAPVLRAHPEAPPAIPATV